MKSVLITGSEGFVGGHLRNELDKYGYKIYGTSLLTPDTKNKDVFQCDITDLNSLSGIIVKIKPDYIVHLAGYVSPKESINEPEKVFHINIDGTKNLLDSVRIIPGYKPRILLVGSAEEFGKPLNDLPFTEDSRLNPINPYAISKMKIWQMALGYIKENSFDIISALPFNHTGPGQSPGFISTDVVNQIVNIEKGKIEPILYTGNVEHRRNISDVRDVVRAYRLLIEQSRTGERYIICADNSVQLKYIVDYLIQLSTVNIVHQIDPERARPADIADISGSHDKITAETGWKPEIPLEKTLSDLLNWYRLKH